MNARTITLSLIAVSLMGLMFALLWVQTGLPAFQEFSPWHPRIELYPSIYAVWLPALYLCFSGLWSYLLATFPDNQRLRAYWRYDCLSYLAVIVIFLGQITWQTAGDPRVWIRGALLLLLAVKSAFLFRMLYQEAYLIRPVVIGLIGAGLHVLLLPFHYQAFELPLPMLLNQQELAHLGILGVKIIGLNLMTVEMFRLSGLLARSAQSAVLSWFVVTFTFPVLGYPKISHILASLFLIFMFRLIFSRLDTRELMLGLLHGRNMMILMKFAMVLLLLLAASIIFWSNVKPGLGFHGSRALHASVLALFDAQGGLFCYAPLYWLTIFGAVYVVFFRIWDGVVLLLAGGLAYTGYHFLAYGILDRVVDPTVTVPFLPIFGVFMAIAHRRFGKMRVFRYLLRLGTLVTVGFTILFLLLFPEFQQIQIKFSAIQHALFQSAGLDLVRFLPSSAFDPVSPKTLLWVGVSLGLALAFCAARTRPGYRVFPITRRRATLRADATFAPFVALTCILLGAGSAADRRPQYDVPLAAPLVMSHLEPETITLLEHPVASRRIRLVGNFDSGAALTHYARLAKITLFGSNQRFETLTLLVGKDLADALFEHPDIRPVIAHGRAALYRSRMMDAGHGATVAVHDYYTELTLPRRLEVQKIVIKLVELPPDDNLSELTVNIKAITLID